MLGETKDIFRDQERQGPAEDFLADDYGFVKDDDVEVKVVQRVHEGFQRVNLKIHELDITFRLWGGGLPISLGHARKGIEALCDKYGVPFDDLIAEIEKQLKNWPPQS